MSIAILPKMRFIPLCVFLWVSYGYADLTISPWTSLFKGVEHAAGFTDTPRLQRVNAIRIDLYDPDISFCTTSSNGDALGDTFRQTGSQFMTSSGAQVAINAHFYNSSADINWNADLMGLCVSNGQVVAALENLHDRAYSLIITQDNVATFQDTSTSTNLTGVWTAVESFAFILINGTIVVDYADPLAINSHPRSAVGLSFNRRYLILLTIDGRQAGYSEGATFYEEAQWLIRFGAYNGLNLDGGGSTHMLISNGGGGSITVNSPSENRAVGNHLGVYAAPLLHDFDSVWVYADFEQGNEADFRYAPAYSGSTTGILSISTADCNADESYAGDGSQRLMIYDNPSVTGGWFVRHIAGASASRSENVPRPADGYVGFFARTVAPGLAVSIAIDNTLNVTADRGAFKTLIPDGQWHYYEWDLDDNSQWTGWINGDGLIDTVDFTIDSIQITGPDANAQVFIDHVAHSNDLSLAYLFSIPGDYEPDGDVDLIDFARFAADWLKTKNFDPVGDMHKTENSIIDIFDLAVFAQNWIHE